MLFFGEAIISLVGDKKERLNTYCICSVFQNLVYVINLSIYFWNSEIVGFIGGDYMITVGQTEILSRFLPPYRHENKFWINYILRLHVKSLIPARRNPSFVLTGQTLTRKVNKESHWLQFSETKILGS